MIAKLRDAPWMKYMAMLILKSTLTVLEIRSPKLYFLLGNLSLDRGKTNWALKAFRRASECAKISTDLVLLADILRKWGYTLLHTEGPTKTAFEKINEAVEIMNDLLLHLNHSTKMVEVAANAYAARGNYFHDAGELEKSKDDFESALAFAEEAGFGQRMATIQGDLGLIALEKKDWEAAESHLSRAHAKAQECYRYALPSSLVRLGRLFMERDDRRKDLDLAEHLLDESLAVAQKNGWSREEADALEALSKLRTLKRKDEKVFATTDT